MKKGLVMEGGGLKGIFTVGVLDVFQEQGIVFDGAVGVSAGAAFGCNFKSRQIGRPLRYNKRFAGDKRYCSWASWLKTGDLFNVQFCYHEIPWKLDLWDQKAYAENPLEFYVVATDVETGKPVYHKCMVGDEADVEWIRASSSIPVFSNIVEIGDLKLLDGGVGDPLPLQFFEEQGYTHNVVITTKPAEFRRKTSRMTAMAEKAYFRKYPDFLKALDRYPSFYNEEMDYLAAQEKAGRAIIIRPPVKLAIDTVEKDPEKLEMIYRMGRKEALRHLEEIRGYLNENDWN